MILFLFLFSLATGAGSPQQREPITVGPYYLSHPVNFPCGRKPEYPEKAHDFRQSVDYTLFTVMRTGFKSTLLGIELGTLEVKGEWSDHYTTEASLSPITSGGRLCERLILHDTSLTLFLHWNKAIFL